MNTTTTCNANLKRKNSSATTTTPTPTPLTSFCLGKDGDKDSVWADEDPDEDVKGWKMNISRAVAGLAEEI